MIVSSPRSTLLSLILLATPCLPDDAAATCNVIPGTVNQFRGALGSVDRPFAMPGDFVELTLRPAVCDGKSRGLRNFDGQGGVTREDIAVTVLFEPPAGGPRNAVVLAPSCTAMQGRLAACTAQLGGGSVECRTAAQPDLWIQRNDVDDRIRFRFPDTDARTGAPDDDRTLAGPATIAVTPVTDALPCGLATSRCADASGLVACVDALYAIDGTCGTSADQIDATFGSFTALPQPNDFEAVCTRDELTEPGSPCDGTATEARLTTDAAGNALIPFDWRGVLVRLEDVPIPRLVRASTSLPAFAGAGDPIRVPDDSFLASYSPEGHRLPPLFTPLADPTDAERATFFGSVDAGMGVVRVARRTACETEPCDAPIFELRDRYVGGVGPVVVAKADYTAKAESPVPLDGLAQTASMFAFVRSEALEGRDLNGDGDATDPVLTLRDGATGELTPIGTDGADGRAATRIRQLPFQYAALAVEDDLVAWLEPEPLEGNCTVPFDCDKNGDGDVSDTVLRILRTYPSSPPQDLLATTSIVADADPVIDDKSLVVSDGLVVWRESEPERAKRRYELVGVGSDGAQAQYGSNPRAMSSDARVVLFEAAPASFGAKGSGNLFLRDRSREATEQVSAFRDGDLYCKPHFTGVISANGRFMAIDAICYDLVLGDQRRGILVRDRCELDGSPLVGCVGSVELLEVETGEPLWISWAASIGDDGRYVYFNINSTGPYFKFIRDRCQTYGRPVSDCVPATTPVNVEWPGHELGNGFSRFLNPGVTPNGRFAAISAIDFGDRGAPAVFLYDHSQRTSRLVWMRESPQANSPGEWALSADARFIVAGTQESLVPSDTNQLSDLYVRDLCSSTAEEVRGCSVEVDRVSADSDGSDLPGHPNLYPENARISFSGRYVAFTLLDSSEQDHWGVFVRDRLTAITTLITPEHNGVPSRVPPFNFLKGLSADGQRTLFGSDSPILVPGDANEVYDAILYGPDSTDCDSDLTGDCDLADLVLSVLDGREGSPVPRHLGPAKAAAAHLGDLAYVDGETGAVRLWRNRQAQPPLDLGLRSEAVDLSSVWIGALASESAIGASLNGDDDTDDLVVHVNRVATASEGSWVRVGQTQLGHGLASDEVQVVSSKVAFLVLESSQGASDLNSDGDADDYVMHLYDAETEGLENLGLASEEFVLGDELLAFRVSESAQAERAENGDLNGDGDDEDAVLFVYDVSAGIAVNTGQAALPCRLEACDPRIPYRVAGDTVTYLTAESEQGSQDLNGDGDASDLVLQVFNAKKALISSAEEARTRLAGASAGICSDTGAACANDAGCGPGASCFVPPGACILDHGTACDPSEPCPSGQFCDGDTSTCRERLEVACRSTAEQACPSGAVCEDMGQEIQRLVAPLAEAPEAAAAEHSRGDLVFASAGVCIDAAGHEHGACSKDEDCPAGTCSLELTTATAADTDADGLADPIDNCPELENADQADLDEDGIGDACDLRTCGNGIVEGRPGVRGDESCDDGNREAGDGCSERCRNEKQACEDGIDNDGDGHIDLGDPGCPFSFGSPEDPPCDDGVDNDGDGLVDFDDPMCQAHWPYWEAPPCGLGAELALLLPLLRLARRRGSAIVSSA